MAAVPRGVRVRQWKNADKSISIRYRVQVKRKGFETDKSFENLADATLFLEDTKTPAGRLAIIEGRDRVSQRLEQAQAQIVHAFIGETMSSGKGLTVAKAVGLFIEREYAPIIENKNGAHSDVKARSAKVNRDRLKKAITVPITRYQAEPSGMWADLKDRIKTKFPQPIGEWEIAELTEQQSTEYIAARLASGIAKSTVKREIGALQSVVNKLRFYDNRAWKALKGHNPFADYDKRLLRGGVKRRRRILSDEEEQWLIEGMAKYANPEAAIIFSLAVLTGLRRGELLTLRWDQIDFERGLLDLDPEQTKAGNDRTVPLLPEALDAIKTLPRKDARLFHYKVEGWKTAWQRIRQAIYEEHPDMERVVFHDCRRTAISRILANITGSSVMVADMLGARNVRNLEETTIKPLKRGNPIKTQEDAMAAYGHESSQTSMGYAHSRAAVDAAAKRRALTPEKALAKAVKASSKAKGVPKGRK